MDYIGLASARARNVLGKFKITTDAHLRKLEVSRIDHISRSRGSGLKTAAEIRLLYRKVKETAPRG